MSARGYAAAPAMGDDDGEIMSSDEEEEAAQAEASPAQVEGLAMAHNPDGASDATASLSGRERTATGNSAFDKGQHLGAPIAYSKGDIVINFTDAGALGVNFEHSKEHGTIRVVGVAAGSQAAKIKQMQPGLVVRSIDGHKVDNLPFAEFTGFIRSDKRPLELSFDQFSTAKAIDAELGSIVVELKKEGSLGLQFEAEGGYVRVVGIAPKSYGASFKELHEGVVVKSIQGFTARNLPFKEIMDFLKTQQRPCVMTFAHFSTRQAYQKGEIVATFGKGPLGAAFETHPKSKSIVVSAMVPGGAAEQVLRLAVGAKAVSIAGYSCEGMSFKEFIGYLKSGIRPVEITLTGGLVTPEASPTPGMAGGGLSADD